MKITKILAMMAIALCAVACSDDDDDNFVSPADIVAGNYAGALTMSVGSTAYDPADATVSLTKSSDAAVTVVLPAVGEGAMAMPEITLEGVTVTTEDDAVYTISADINKTVGTTNWVGTLAGTIEDGEAVINYSVKPGAMPMSINFEFIGDKQ